MPGSFISSRVLLISTPKYSVSLNDVACVGVASVDALMIVASSKRFDRFIIIFSSEVWVCAEENYG